MPESDLTARIGEQLAPIIETMDRRIQTDLPDRDRAAIAHALVDAATTGARVAWATMLANLAEAGVQLPPNVGVSGLQSADLWPFDD